MAYLVPIGEVGWSWVEVGFLEKKLKMDLKCRGRKYYAVNFKSNLC